MRVPSTFHVQVSRNSRSKGPRVAFAVATSCLLLAIVSIHVSNKSQGSVQTEASTSEVSGDTSELAFHNGAHKHIWNILPTLPKLHSPKLPPLQTSVDWNEHEVAEQKRKVDLHALWAQHASEEEYHPAGSAQPGSLHGHINLPDPLKVVHNAQDAANQVQPFHHNGASFPPSPASSSPSSSESEVPTRPSFQKSRGGKARSGNVVPQNLVSAVCFDHAGCYKNKDGVYVPCPAGFYCPVGSVKPVGCPANTVSPVGADNVTYCEARGGYYGAAGSAASRCPGGFYCAPGGAEPLPCPNNTESDEGSDALTDCVSIPGYRGQPGSAAVECANNTYCPPGKDQWVRCPPNTEAPKGSWAPEDCKAVPGTYGLPGREARDCPEGGYCPAGAVGPTACPPNTHSAAGADDPSDCKPLQGYYGAPGEAAELCPPDHFCTPASVSPKPCPNNTEAPAASTLITDCKAKEGYYGSPGVNAYLCPPSSYCVPGEETYRKCPANTASPEGSSALGQCVALAGYFGRPGAEAAPCPVGYYCPEGSINAAACPDNTRSIDGSSDLGDCLPRHGYYGPAGAAATICPAGSYCAAGSAAPLPCPPNTWSTVASDEIVDCTSIPGYYGEPGVAAILCPARAYCPADVALFLPCPANTVTAAGAATLRNCTAAAGYYGEPGAAATVCPADFYCPFGSNSPAGCPQNTQAIEGSTDVTDCKAVPGYYGPWGAEAITCTAGAYCPVAARQERPCPANTTSPINSVLLTDCKPIPGYFGTPGTEGTACLQSWYCEGGDTPAKQCPPNTNSPVGATSSADCLPRAGFYGSVGAAATLCPAGSYCPSKSVTARPCPAHTVSVAGAAALEDCRAAPGYYGQAGTEPEECPPNQYCPGGGLTQNLCPDNTESAGLSSSVKDCKAKAGYFALPGLAAKPCPPGFYCPAAAGGPQPCPPQAPISPVGSTTVAACKASGWTLQLYTVPSGTAVTPVVFPGGGALVGTSNTVQAVAFRSLQDFQSVIPQTPPAWYAWRFLGRLPVAAPGDYTFCVTSDDGGLLYIDPTPVGAGAGAGGGGAAGTASRYLPVVDVDGLHAPTQKCSVVTLATGSYNLQATGFQAGGGVIMLLEYSGPDTSNKLAPVPSESSVPPPSLAAETPGWDVQIFSLPAGPRSTPVAFPAAAYLGEARGVPVINMGSDQEFRNLVGKTPNIYAWRIFGRAAIVKGGDYTLCDSSDDGSLFYMALRPESPYEYSLLIDNDGAHGDVQICKTVTLQPGQYNVKVAGFQQGGGVAMRVSYKGPDTQGAILRLRSIDSTPPPNPDSPAPAWALQVFSLPPGPSRLPTAFPAASLVGQSFAVPRLSFDSSDDFRKYVPATPKDNFAARAYAVLAVAAGGAYSICTSSDDGSALYMDLKSGPGTRVVNNDGLHGPAKVCQSVQLDPGTYPVKVYFFQAGGGVQLSAFYSGPDTNGNYWPIRSVNAVIPSNP